MKKFIFMALFFCFTTISLAQQFNLPPGSALKGDVKVIDYSYKLENIEKYENFSFKEDYLNEFSSEDLQQMKSQSPASYDYYMQAVRYFTLLSERVKKIYTIDELWHIYQFDQPLKEKLTTY
jgi:hypothetical protein